MSEPYGHKRYEEMTREECIEDSDKVAVRELQDELTKVLRKKPAEIYREVMVSCLEEALEAWLKKWKPIKK